MIKNILNFFSLKTRTNKILLIVFSLIFEKSIFISPFTLLMGFWGVFLGLLLWVAVFFVCLSAVYFLDKVSWQYKKTPVKKLKILLYMVPSAVLSTALLVVFFPGIMSWDSMYIWHSATVNEYSNLHPVTYVLFTDLMESIAGSPWLVIAVQFTYSAFVFAYTGYVFEGMGISRKLCWAAVIILSLYPVNAMSNVTMLKDVPYIMSLVLLSAIILKSITESRFGFGTAAAILAVALTAMFSRHNGLLSVPLALVLLTVFHIIKKKKTEAVLYVIVAVTAIACFFIINKEIEYQLGNKYWQRSNASDILMMPSGQLSYTIDKNWDSLTNQEKTTAEKYLDTGYISFQKKGMDNWQFNNRYLETLNMENILADKNGFLKFYFDTFRKFPLDMIKEYEQLTGILWATPNYGYTVVRNQGIPEKYPGLDLEPLNLFPKISSFIYGLPQVYFLLRPALWLWLSLLLLFVIKKGRRLMGFLIISPMLANAFGFLFGTPAQNVRYLYCNFNCFIILLAFAFMTVKTVSQAKSGKQYPDKNELSE